MNLEQITSLLTPALVSTAITALLAPLIFFWLKRRDERRKRTFEIRYAEYKHYLRALDEIAAVSRNESEQFFAETISNAFHSILTDSDNEDEVLLGMNEALMGMTSRMGDAIIRAEGELNGLRLVCSEKLLGMINEYVQLQRDLLGASSDMMKNWQQIDINNPQASISGEVKKQGERSLKLYNEIVDQMREELNIR